MNKTILFLFLFFLVDIIFSSVNDIQQNLRSELTCENSPFIAIYVPDNLNNRKVIIDAPEKVDCEDIKDFMSAIYDINSMITGHLDIPKVGLVTEIEADKPFFLDLLSVPVAVMLEGEGKHSNSTKYIFAHEYGHAIFRESLLHDKRFKDVEEEFQLNHRESHLLKVYAEELKILQRNARKMKKKFLENSSEFKKYKELAHQIKIKRDKVDDREYELIEDDHEFTLKMMFENRLYSPYNELFADTVSVLYSYQGNAVSDSLFRTKLWGSEKSESEDKSEYRDAVKSRDFTEKANRIDKWKVLKNDHNLFAPVRYHLWDNYLENFLRSDNYNSAFRGKVLKSLLTAIKDEIIVTRDFINKREFDTNYILFGLYFQFDDEQIINFNKRLIDKIDKQFSWFRR